MKLKEGIANLTDSVKEYIKLQIDIAKLTAMEKGTQIFNLLITMMISFILGAMFLFFLMVGFVIWYGSMYNNYITPILIILGFIVLLTILFIFFRKKIIIPNIIQSLSEILFKDDDFLDEDDEVQVVE